MKILSRQALETINDRKQETVDVPEWGGAVYLRELSAGDHEDLELFMQSSKQDKHPTIYLRTRLVALALVDHEGNRLYKDEDIEILRSKSSTVINRLCAHVVKQNNLGSKAMETLAGN